MAFTGLQGPWLGANLQVVSDAQKLWMASQAETVQIAEEAMVRKAMSPPLQIFMAALPGGAYISLGFVFYTTTQVGAEALPWGVAKLIGGLVFSLGLITCVVTGADLFTSTTMTLIGKAAGRLTWPGLLKHWSLVYIGNAVGAATIVALIYFGGVYNSADGGWGQVILATADKKLHHTFVEAFTLGVGCNLLVCLGVWMAYSGRTSADKILSLVLPVALFVSTGFEHSVANMFMIPLGILIQPELAPGTLPDLTWANFVVDNLVPVTLGNIVGGGVMIGIFYWILHRRAVETGRASHRLQGTEKSG